MKYINLNLTSLISLIKQNSFLRDEIIAALESHDEAPFTTSVGFVSNPGQPSMTLFIGGNVDSPWRSKDGACLTLVAKESRSSTMKEPSSVSPEVQGFRSESTLSLADLGPVARGRITRYVEHYQSGIALGQSHDELMSSLSSACGTKLRPYLERAIQEVK